MGLVRRATPLQRRLLLASIAVSAVILLFAKAKNGVYLGCLTDHFHHARATWNFFRLGFDVYGTTHGQACATVPYPHEPRYTCTWETWPVAYPPGMFVVFALPAVVGRIAWLSDLELGKFIVGYLVLLTHAALWAFSTLARRVGSHVWTAVVAVFWIFMVRTALMGLYEGAWILTATLAVDALRRSLPARSLLWLAATALLSYRAVCLVPLAVVALAKLPRSNETMPAKVSSVAVGGVAVVVVIACARALLRYGPGELGHSAFIPLQPYGWLLLGVGIAVAVFTAVNGSLLVAACVAFSSFLSLYHAGHNWHATVLVTPLFAIVLARRPPLATQIALGLWLVFYLQYVFGYPPLIWLDELLRFVERGGRPGCLLPFES